MKKLIVLSIVLFIASCNSNDDSIADTETEAMYFPENNSDVWETKSAEDLGWNESEIQPLLNFLEEKNTRSFIMLVNGRIVMEHYFNGHTATTPWYWASAGKTLTAAVTGIAEDEGFLDIDDKVSDYLVSGWTNAPLNKENLITTRHLLTMTSGLNDELGDNTAPQNLQYTADAGTRWAYHNVYVKLQDVVASATGQSWDNYFNTALKQPIGMTGAWQQLEGNSVYFSNTRSMARFGLLALNKGKWKNTQIVSENYFNASVNTSQDINKSYGYLWWLNGKESYRLPQTQYQFNGTLVPSGLNDMYMALGKNDQKIYVISSKKMVVIRMGNAADEENFALSGFDDNLWQKINNVIN